MMFAKTSRLSYVSRVALATSRIQGPKTNTLTSAPLMTASHSFREEKFFPGMVNGV